MWRSISPEQDTVLVLLKESPGRSRLASQLADARSNVDGHVVEAIQILGHIGEVFCVVADMQHNEPRFWMTSEHAVPCLNQFFIARKVASVEGPVRMIAKFFISLIEAVRRGEEGDRIRDMDG